MDPIRSELERLAAADILTRLAAVEKALAQKGAPSDEKKASKAKA